MRSWLVAVACLALGACHASIGDAPNGDGGGDSPDAAGGGGGGGGGSPDAPLAGGDAAVAAPDAAAPIKRVVYLNFDGQALTKGSASDATAGVAAWLYQSNTGTAPVYESGVSTRAQDITTISTGVASRLANIATVTTTKPATGPYVMIIYGGTAADVHSFFGVAVNQLDCGDAVQNDIGWIAESVSPVDAVDTTMGAIGLGLGLTATTKQSDCMCSWGNNCTPTANCTLDNAIARDTNVRNDPNTGVAMDCGGGTENELTTFQTAFQ
jgi:hypothetical protein